MHLYLLIDSVSNYLNVEFISAKNSTVVKNFHLRNFFLKQFLAVPSRRKRRVIMVVAGGALVHKLQMHVLRIAIPSAYRVCPDTHVRRLMSTTNDTNGSDDNGENTRVYSFDSAEKVSTFSKFFENGSPMWHRISQLAEKQCGHGMPKSILDLGCGPGEPSCHMAMKFRVPVVATDMAPHMINFAKQRIDNLGLSHLVTCMTMDMQDQSLHNVSHNIIPSQ